MLVLHGAWGVERTTGDAAFLLWAEDRRAFSEAAPSDAVETYPRAETGSETETRAEAGSGADTETEPEPGSTGPRPHPLLAAGRDLRQALASLVDLTGGKASEVTSTAASWAVHLPTRGDRPLPSPRADPESSSAAEEGSVASPDQNDQTTVRIEAWQVRGRAVRAADAVWLLALLPTADGGLVSEAGLGVDVRYWSAVAKLALDLVARERFVPTLTVDGPARSGARARWRPVLSDPRDADRFGLLARSMPPICRAIGDVAPPPMIVLGRALGSAVDALVADRVARVAEQRGRYQQLPRPVTASDAWLFALMTGKSAVQEGGYDLGAFAERVAEWVAPLGQGAAGPSLRTCFRLEPPDMGAPDTGEKSASGSNGSAPKRGKSTRTRKTPAADERAWTLRFLLQAADDPSVLIPAERVWQEQGDALRVLSRRLDRPQERFLTDLGRAAALFPPLEVGLAEARPTECRLTTDEAYQFLREAAPLLEESGFGVLVPPWWDRQRPRRLGIRVRLGADGPVGTGQLGQDSLVQFDWKLALGDEELEPAEFRRLARLKVPLVNVRGQWVELDTRRIEEAIAFWEKRRKRGPLSGAEALQIALGPTDETPGLPVVEVDAEGWLGDLLGRLGQDEAAPRTFYPPNSFVGQLRPYQERGAAWLLFLARHGLGGCLADDMGLGKSVEYIAFLLARLEASRNGASPESDDARDSSEKCPDSGPALLVCPTSVLGNWRHEVARFAPTVGVYTHHGPDRRLGPDFATAVRGQDLVLTTYPLTYRDEQTLGQVAWSGIVLDEAQNVKNPATQQARAVRALSRVPSPTRPYRFALTGTPVENRLAELWSLLDFLNPGYLGSGEAFRRTFALPIERWQSAERAAQLRRLVRPFILRRLKTDPTVIQDLPDKLELKVFCTLTREQATLYEAVVEQMLRSIDQAEGIERRGRILTALLRLKQVCNHPANFLGDGSQIAGRSGKVARLDEMLEEVLAEGDAALIFTQFPDFGRRLCEHLCERLGREVLFLHGGTPARARDELVARFQHPDGPPLFLLSLKAGGLGLNLTRATHVFHFDRWWNPAVEDQATDRAFRIGQTRNVQVHKFICAGTLEERIDALIESKQALAQQVIGAGEAWLTELSTTELRELMALRAESVVDE